MIYKDFKGLKLSTLGYGGMRLPTTDRQEHIIDEAGAAKLVEYAYNNGVNYFDTAFFYHAGGSERVLGNILAQFPRDTWYLADKMPGNFMDIVDGKIEMDLGSMGMKNMTYNDPSEVFEYQLNATGVDYFDFYLLHNVTESTYELYTDEKLGMVDYLIEQKKAGRIKHIGFSTHGRDETIDKFLKHYDCFEFVMMQLNYLDWTLQEAGKKYEVITKHGLPVFVMEPVRGGKLSNPGEITEAILKESRPNDSAASWAFRFLQSLPNVSVVISGMSTMEQIEENIEIFSKNNPTTGEEKDILWKAVESMASFVPCTSCRYCCEACPQKLNIPMLIATYNEAANIYDWYITDILETLTDNEKPQACTGCGACSSLCPQSIDIADAMIKFSTLIENAEKK